MTRWARSLAFRLRALLGRRRIQRDLDEEVAFHLEREEEKHRRSGLSPEEARRLARLKFGGEDRFKEQARDAWGVGPLVDLAGDVRYAARQLRRNPAFSSLAVLTLALGIGGTVAVFSVVDSLLLRPLPFPGEGDVVTLWDAYDWRGEEFDYVKGIGRGFESMAAYSNNGYALRTDAGSSLILATVASSELFDVVEAPPLLGRTFRRGEDRPGAEPTVVLTYGLWQRDFGGDPDVVGRRVDMGGSLRTVIGVMPEGFYFPTPESEAFVPLDLDPADPAYSGNGWLVLLARLKHGVADARIQSDLDAITGALGERYDYPEAWDKTRNPYVTPVREYLLGDARPVLLTLLGAIGVLLLIACANVAALVLTRTIDRDREMSTRTALGAGRSRLARQVLTESFLLGLVAAALGTALAAGVFDVLVSTLPVDPAFRQTITLDWAAFLAALLLALACGGLVALTPIRSLLAGDLSGRSFSERSPSGAAPHAGRAQSVLVAAEVLLAVLLVSGASLLVRTVHHLRDLDLGFDPSGVLAVDVLLPSDASPAEGRDAFFERLVERTRALPGVSGAGLTNRLPLRDGGYQGVVTVEDRPDLQGAARPNAMYRPLSPGTLALLRARLVAGRELSAGDRADAPSVAVVNETFARNIWGGAESALGKTYANSFGATVRVVGVVEDMAVTDLVGEQPMTGYYPWPQAMSGASYGILLLRSAGETTGLAGPVRAIVAELDPRAAVGRIETMDDAVASEMAEPLRLRFYLGLFGLLGMVLGTVGVYGVVSYSVQRRRAEFGIRLALGAAPGQLLSSVVRGGVVPVVAGVAGGTLLALLTSRLLSTFLFGVAPTDPASLLFSAVLLLTAGVLSAALPAWRASTTAPASALQAD